MTSKPLHRKIAKKDGGFWEGVGDNLIRGLSLFFDQLGQDKTVQQGITAIEQAGGEIRRQCLGVNGFYDANPPEADKQALGLYGLHPFDQKLY